MHTYNWPKPHLSYIEHLCIHQKFHGQKHELPRFESSYLGVHIATNLTWKNVKFSHISFQDLSVKDTHND